LLLASNTLDINLVVFFLNYCIYQQETQLSLTNRTTRLEVSQGHQTWYYSIWLVWAVASPGFCVGGGGGHRFGVVKRPKVINVCRTHQAALFTP